MRITRALRLKFPSSPHMKSEAELALLELFLHRALACHGTRIENNTEKIKITYHLNCVHADKICELLGLMDGNGILYI